MGGRALRTVPGAGRRPDPPQGKHHRHRRQQSRRARGKGRERDHPIVFGVGEDPVKLGLVASLARPGGNATGVNFFTGEVAAKRLGLLRELLPGATRIAVLVNPANRSTAKSTVKDVMAAGTALGLQIQIFNAGTIREIDTAYASLVRERADALVVAGDGFFNSRRVQLAMLAVRHAVPTTYPVREYTEAAG